MRSVIWSVLVLGGAALVAFWLHNLEFEVAAPNQARRSVINAAVTEIEGWRYVHHDAEGRVVLEVQGARAHPQGRPDADRGIRVQLDAPRLELQRAPAPKPGARRMPLHAGAARGFVAASPGGGFQVRLEGGVRAVEGSLRIETETLLLSAPGDGALRSWARERLAQLRQAIAGRNPAARRVLDERLDALEATTPDPLARLRRVGADVELAPLLPDEVRAGLAPRSHLQLECPKPVRLSQPDPALAATASGLTAERPGDVFTLRPPVTVELEAGVLLGEVEAPSAVKGTATGTSVATLARAGLQPLDRIQLTTQTPVAARFLRRDREGVGDRTRRATELRFLGQALATIRPVAAASAPHRDLRPIDVEVRGGLTLTLAPARRAGDHGRPGRAGATSGALARARGADLLLREVTATRAGVRLLAGHLLRWTGSTQKARLEGGSGDARASLAAEGARPAEGAAAARRVRARAIEVDVTNDVAYLLEEVEIELPVPPGGRERKLAGVPAGSWTLHAPAAAVLLARDGEGRLSGLQAAIATSLWPGGVTLLGPPRPGRAPSYRAEGGQIRLKRPRPRAEIVVVEPGPWRRSRQRLWRELGSGGRRLRERIEADRFTLRRSEGTVLATGDVRLAREDLEGAPLVTAVGQTLSVELTEAGGRTSSSTLGRLRPKTARLDGGTRDLEAVVYPAAWQRSATPGAGASPERAPSQQPSPATTHERASRPQPSPATTKKIKMVGRTVVLGFGVDPRDAGRVRLTQARCEAGPEAGALCRVVPAAAGSAPGRILLSGRRARFARGAGGGALSGVVVVEAPDGGAVLFERGAASGPGPFERVEAGRAELDLRRLVVRLRGGVRGSVRRSAPSGGAAGSKPEPERFEVSSEEADAELDLRALRAAGAEAGAQKARRGVETLTLRRDVVFRYRGRRPGIPARVEAASARYDRLTGEVVFEGAPLRTDRGQTLRRLVVTLD